MVQAHAGSDQEQVVDIMIELTRLSTLHRAVVACRAVFTDPQLAAARIARHLTEGDNQALRLRLAEAPGDFGRPRPIKRSRRPRYLIVDNASLRDALVDALLAWKALTES